MLLGMAAGAALGAVGVMAATQNPVSYTHLRAHETQVMKGAENAVLQLDRMVGDFVEKHMDS